MKRRVFTFMSAMSMLLFAATMGTYIWSYEAPIVWPYDTGMSMTNSGQGTSRWVWRTRFLGHGGIGCVETTWHLGPYEITGDEKTIWRVPLWPFILATGTLPVTWLAPIARATARVVLARVSNSMRRRQPGRCVTCGYDLRATPERCPECGTVVVKKT
ncbi:MAG: hypothetical protein JWL69_1209 [Phycisphaerales bacterium]|nr:hypothetical protein [Phycisphaerales bacterium]MDB5357105.1 hypothetical protein [Phycisphaerales bacterium]